MRQESAELLQLGGAQHQPSRLVLVERPHLLRFNRGILSRKLALKLEGNTARHTVRNHLPQDAALRKVAKTLDIEDTVQLASLPRLPAQLCGNLLAFCVLRYLNCCRSALASLFFVSVSALTCL